ncbi:MAG: radical SAM protein, partial [Deltaproteobacteria bacterium]|nr:radical SAM protein [Deltaproteobacteria bacterium]
MKPFIIPFFIHHQGCPHQCLYCDQRVSGGRREESVNAETVEKGIISGLASKRLRPGMKVEIAFFGGTFTAMSMTRQTELLGAVQPFISGRRVHGLRLSTRPDALSEEQVEFLSRMGVTTVEIGAQSMDDRVLAASRRGHTADDTLSAARRVKEAGLELGIQLLLGLPGEDEAGRKTTLDKILWISPNEVRLYPLLVFRNTSLADWYYAGKYHPLTLSDAVKTSAVMLKAFTRAGITVTRIGLQGSVELTDGLIAGPFHPALGHMVKAEIFYEAMVQAIRDHPPMSPESMLTVSSRDIS